MHASRTARRAVILLAVLAAAAHGQEKKPEPRRGIDRDTVAAYQKLGGTYGLVGGPPAGFGAESDPAKIDKRLSDPWPRELPGRPTLPGFMFEKPLPGKLPAVGVPFGLLLDNEAVTDDGMKHLAGAKNLTALFLFNGISTSKGGWEVRLTDAGLKEVATCEDLVVLELIDTGVTAKGLEQLAPLKKLRTLSLQGRDVSDATLASLRKAGLLHALTHANIRRGDEHESPANTPGKVVGLNLTSTKVTDAGMRELAHLRDLRWLSLLGTKVTDEGLKELAGLTELTELELIMTKATAAGVGTLRKALPKCRIYSDLDPREPSKPGRPDLQPLDEATRGAYAKIGSVFVTRHWEPDVRGDYVPVICFDGTKEIDLSNKFPAVGVPFGLHFSQGAAMTDAGVKQIPHLDNLVYLHLSDVKVTDGGLKQLKGLKKLERVELSNAKITDETLRVLRELGLLHTLAGANFCPTDTDRRDGKRVWGSAAGVRMFDLWGTGVTDAGLKELAAFENLEGLLLTEPVTGSGLEDLAGLKKLTRLRLLSDAATDDGMKGVAALENLSALELYRPRVTDAGLEHLGKLGRLAELNLGGAGVTGAGLKHLAGLPLTRLDLSGTGLTDAGVAHLPALRRLTHLDLSGTPITDAGLKELAGMKTLTSLKLSRTKVTAEGVGLLRVELPECKITR